MSPQQPTAAQQSFRMYSSCQYGLKVSVAYCLMALVKINGEWPSDCMVLC